MIKHNNLSNFKPEKKPRISLFIDQKVINRAKAKGALDGDTLSEVAEKALIEYTTDKRIKESLSASDTITFTTAGAASFLKPKHKYTGGAVTLEEV